MKIQIEALRDALEYTKKLYLGIEKAIELLRQKDTQAGYQLVVQITEGLGWLGDVLRLTQDIQIQKIDSFEINQLLQDMVEAMENEDIGLLADLMEFELLEQLKKWEMAIQVNVHAYVE